jgi:Ca-activated chloride channel homolog
VIQWRDPLSLAALAMVPALVLFLLWSTRRRRQALETFIAGGLLPAVAPDLDARRRTMRGVLLAGAVAALALAIAGPMWGFRWQQVQREGIDLIVAIDTSRSMLATDVKPNRLARAKLAVQDLLQQLRGDRIGLVAFAGTAFLQCPLTLDFGAFLQSLDAIEAGIIPRGGTSLAAAIDLALAAFEGRQAEHQALVIITDGEDHDGNVKEAVQRAADRRIKIYTVGIGTAEGELIPLERGGFLKDRKGQVVKSRLDETTLQEVATDTGGAYLHATDTAFGLAELYRDYIATMEKRELASTLERRFEHRFQWPLLIAFLLLLAEPLVGERRPPAREARRTRFGWPWRRSRPETTR